MEHLGGTQGAETTAGTCAAHPGYPALPGAATACHVPPGEKVCTHLHIPSALCHGRFAPLATDSLSSKRSSRPKARAKTNSLTGISLDLKVRYKSRGKDDLVNAAVMFMRFQTFKQEALHPQTGQPTLYFTLQTYRSLRQLSFPPS